MDDKSNDITATPRLLSMLELSGFIVTIDAMGCQKEIAHKIVERGAAYTPSLKQSQRRLHEEVSELLDDARREYFAVLHCDRFETVEMGQAGWRPVGAWRSRTLRSSPTSTTEESGLS